MNSAEEWKIEKVGPITLTLSYPSCDLQNVASHAGRIDSLSIITSGCFRINGTAKPDAAKATAAFTELLQSAIQANPTIKITLKSFFTKLDRKIVNTLTSEQRKALEAQFPGHLTFLSATGLGANAR